MINIIYRKEDHWDAFKQFLLIGLAKRQSGIIP
jgi:hypothetical protein